MKLKKTLLYSRTLLLKNLGSKTIKYNDTFLMLYIFLKWRKKYVKFF